jgi:hypothetical protein
MQGFDAGYDDFLLEFCSLAGPAPPRTIRSFADLARWATQAVDSCGGRTSSGLQ